MFSIKKTAYSYRISLPKNEKINIVNIYNGLFFSIFPLKGLRVFKHDQQIQVDSSNNVQEILDDKDDKDDNNLIDIFGKERVPNSYSVLPLAKDETERETANIKSNNDESDEGLYDSMSSYLTKYLPQMFSKENTENIDYNVVDITIPIEHEHPVMLLEDLLGNLPVDELYNINDNSNVTYDLLLSIIKDFYIQIHFLLNNGFIFKDFSLNSILYVQNHYVIFDSTNIDTIKDNKDEQLKIMNIAFLKLITQILKIDISSGELSENLKNIQNSSVFYFLKRIDREGQLLWL